MAVSALTGAGIDEMLKKVSHQLFENFLTIDVRLPYQEGALVSLFHEQGHVERLEYIQGGVHIQGRIPGRLLAYYRPYEKKS